MTVKSTYCLYISLYVFFFFKCLFIYFCTPLTNLLFDSMNVSLIWWLYLSFFLFECLSFCLTIWFSLLHGSLDILYETKNYLYVCLYFYLFIHLKLSISIWLIIHLPVPKLHGILDILHVASNKFIPGHSCSPLKNILKI